MAITSSYSDQLQQTFSNGICILNAPVGNFALLEQAMVDHVRSIQPLLDAIQKLEDAHVALHLLRSCFAVCRTRHLWLTTPPLAAKSGSRLFDNMIQNCFRSIMGGVLDTKTFHELQLPLRSCIPKKESFGIEITSRRTLLK